MSKTVATLLGLAGVACGGPASVKPTWVDDASRHPRFAPARFVTSAGSAESRTAAEERAKAGVIAQVSSEISAEVRLIARETTTQTGTAATEVLQQSIHSRSAFRHGELVHLDPGGYWRDGPIHYAFAYLPRAAALDALRVDAAPVEQSLAESGCRAYQSAGPLGHTAAAEFAACPGPGAASVNAPDFAVAWREYGAHYGQWAAVRAQMRALGRAGGDWATTPTDWLRSLRVMSGEIRRRSQFMVNVSGQAEEGTLDHVRQVIAQALGGLGLTVAQMPAQDPCTASSGDDPLLVRTVVRANVKVDSGLGSLGPRVKIRIPTRVESCAGGATELDLAGDGAVAIHPSRADRALTKALEKLDARSVANRLRPALGGLCPLP